MEKDKTFENYNPEDGGFKPLLKDLEYCYFIKEFKNYLLCRDKKGANLYVAKPVTLRRAPFDATTQKIWNGTDFDEVSYSYPDADIHLTRTEGDTEKTISPPYMKGELIHILKTFTGLTHCQYLDINVAARSFQGGGGDSYEGYFKATKTDDIKVTISAGRYQINLNSDSVTEEELTMSQTSATEYVYFEANKSSGTWVYELKSGTGIPVDEAEVLRQIICEVEFSGNVISNVIQHQYGIIRGVTFLSVTSSGAP